jgi:hypothetical protein
MGREEEERQWEGKEEEEAGPAAVEMQRGGESPRNAAARGWDRILQNVLQ